MRSILKFISDNFNKPKKKWKYTDTIIKIEDIVPAQFPEFGEKFKLSGLYTCIRDLEYTCLFIKGEYLCDFLKTEDIYDKNTNCINLSNLFKRTIKEECYCTVASKCNPPAVDIKQVKVCRMNNYDIYLERIITLNTDESLFIDLINLKALKDKYNLEE